MAKNIPDWCHYIKEQGRRIFIPGCMGGVHRGPGGCTCDKPAKGERRERDPKLEIQRLRRENAELKKQVKKLQRCNTGGVSP